MHATLKQRLDAVHKLCHQYNIKTICQILKGNHNAYYKHFFFRTSALHLRKLGICKHILQIYTDYDKSLGTYKIRRVLECDYGINHLNQQFNPATTNSVWG